jgi:hypothetical protein
MLQRSCENRLSIPEIEHAYGAVFYFESARM